MPPTPLPVVAVHREPRFDLLTEPWLPVTFNDGTVTQIGLVEAFCEGHRIADIVEPDPLERYALTRFLIAESYLLVDALAGHDWRSTARSGAPLPADRVREWFKGQNDRFWLFHPTTPFMQDPSIRSAVTVTNPKKLHRYPVLLPHVPSGTNEVWKYEQEAAGDAGLSFAEAARALVVRHFGAVPGNEMSARYTGGATKYVMGGLIPTTASGHTATHALLRSATLLQTVLSNHVKTVSADTGKVLCWQDPNPLNVRSTLWAYTASHAAAYLAEPDDDRVRTLLRSPRAADPQVWKKVMLDVRDGDPHTLRYPRKNRKPSEPQTSKHSLPTGESAARFAFGFHQRLDEHKRFEPGVILRSERTFPCPGALQFVSVSFGGSTSLRLQTVYELVADRDAFEMPASQHKVLLTVLTRVGGKSQSARSYLCSYVPDAVIGKDADPAARDAVRGKVEAAFWDALDRIFDDVLRQAVAGHTVSQIDTDAWRDGVVRSVLGVYDEMTRRYSTGGVSAAHIARYSDLLRHRLREVLV